MKFLLPVLQLLSLVVAFTLLASALMNVDELDLLTLNVMNLLSSAFLFCAICFDD